jgi:hypothetical protein
VRDRSAPEDEDEFREGVGVGVPDCAAFANIVIASFPTHEAAMHFRITSCLLSCALIAAACSDLSGPHGTVRRYVGHPPSNTMGLTVDWYDCWSIDGGQTWTCSYSHTDYNTGEADYWDPYDGFHTTGDCSMGAVARYCDNNFQPEGSPYTDPREIGRADEADDEVFAVPHCPASPTETREAYKAYCAGHTPNASQLALLRAALDRMRQIGGICGTLAGIGDAVLARMTLRMFPQSSFTISGHAPVAGGSSGANSWTILSEDLTNVAYDASHYLWYQNVRDGLWYKVTLQTVLAHELDHLRGADGHIYENGIENPFVTTNTRQCSDVDMGSGLVTHP